LLIVACVSGHVTDEDGKTGEDFSTGGDSGTGSGGDPTGGNTQGGMAGQTGAGGMSGGGSGGAMGSGGVQATGGAFPTGGSPATGGAFPTGGTPATGGAFPTGGSSTGGAMTGGTGGSAGKATGGTATGGSAGKATGGTSTGGTSTGGTSTGGTATGGTGGTVAPPPNINGGQMAWASRYWDCCKPACGWSANVGGGNPMRACNMQNQTLSDNGARNACESGGSAFMCWNGAPWSVGGQLSYGFVAASGGNYVCGRCYHLQFNGTGHNGTNPGVTAINGKHMIVQVINNGGVAQDQFDLLVPGGGVGALNACDDQWGSVNLGAQYGGFRTTCGNNADCVRQMCQAAFSNKPELMAGCEWFIGWYAMADNPNVVYERIACPAALTQRSGLSDR
jgi:hypothetical protein